MTQREKLMELICKSAPVEYTHAEAIADCLLANGVVVLPCKVGDTVYVLSDNDYEEMAVIDVTVNMAGDFLIQAACSGFCNYEKCKKVFCDRTRACHVQTYSYNIGKTIFLTREEAEAALKGSDL